MQEEMGIGMKAGAMIGEGIVQGNALRRDAARDDENGRMSLLDGAFAEVAIRRRERAAAGEAIVAMGSSGVALGEGSAFDLLLQSAKNRELAVLEAQYGAGSEARGHFQKGNDKRTAARSATIGGFVRAGTTILTGMSAKQDADRVAAASADLRRSQLFPGGMRLPMPNFGYGRPVYTRGGTFGKGDY